MEQQLLNVGSQFVSIIALAVFPVLAGFIAAWLKAKIAVAKAELERQAPDAFAHLTWFAGIAVNAAEASGMNGLIKDKKKFAVNLVQQMLSDKGMIVDLNILDAAIEDAWIKAFGPAAIQAAPTRK